MITVVNVLHLMKPQLCLTSLIEQSLSMIIDDQIMLPNSNDSTLFTSIDNGLQVHTVHAIGKHSFADK